MAITEPSWSVPARPLAPSPAESQSVANAIDSGGVVTAGRQFERSRPPRLVDDFHRADGPISRDVSICVRKTIVIQVVASRVEKFNAALPKS